MKVENGVIPPAETGALGTHQFLDEFALAYHCAVAERLRLEPAAVVNHARRTLDRWAGGGAFDPGETESLEEWQRILDSSDVEQLVAIITDPSDEGQRLRQSSPFVGSLSPQERLEILAACEQRATA